MREHLRLFVGAALLALAGTAAAQAGDPCPTACEPGYTIVEEICYKEVIRKVCKAVPETKKKTVYSCKEEDFCVPKCRGLCHGHGGDDCGCATPRTRRVLVKKEVTEECPSVKWVVEKVVEVVPYKVYRKVPCTTAPPCQTAPAAGASMPGAK
jgi:hypothetical protein